MEGLLSTGPTPSSFHSELLICHELEPCYIERAVTPRHKEEAKVGVHGGNPQKLPGPIDAETKDEAEAEAEAEAPGQTPVVTAGSPVSIEALEGEQTGEEV